MYKGAGVLVYHIDEKTKGLSVYLGKRVDNPDRGMWSLFDGGIEKTISLWNTQHFVNYLKKLFSNLISSNCIILQGLIILSYLNLKDML